MEWQAEAPGERGGFLPHLESRPVIISIQLVVSGAQNGERREGVSERAAPRLPTGWTPTASMGRGRSQEWVGPRR